MFRHVAQSSIDALFLGVDRVVVKESLAPNARVLHDTSLPGDLASLKAVLRVRPSVSTALCVCEPMPVIYLMAGSTTRASLAWENDRFTIESAAYQGYAELTDVSLALTWFDQHQAPLARSEYLIKHPEKTSGTDRR